MIDKITAWIGNIYNTHGWGQALIVLVAIFAMVIATLLLFGPDAIGRWLMEVGT